MESDNLWQDTWREVNPSHKARWDHTIDQVVDWLTGVWGETVPTILPTKPTLELAIKVAIRVRDLGWLPAAAVYIDDGGYVMFERRVGRITQTLQVNEDLIILSTSKDTIEKAVDQNRYQLLNSVKLDLYTMGRGTV